MKKKLCFICKSEFEVVHNSRYERKYCLKCSKKRKKEWDNQWKIKFEDLPDE